MISTRTPYQWVWCLVGRVVERTAMAHTHTTPRTSVGGLVSVQSGLSLTPTQSEARCITDDTVVQDLPMQEGCHKVHGVEVLNTHRVTTFVYTLEQKSVQTPRSDR